MTAGLRLDADFTEDAVGLAIESLLTLLSFPRLRFSIEPFSRSRERWLGADARLDGRRIRGFRPFYMQFKRPSAFPDSSNSRIVVDRKRQGLSVAPRSLFFRLRDKKPNHRDYQHNTLYRLRKRLQLRNLGDAAYVCPLFLDRAAYRFHIHLAGLVGWPRWWRLAPWELEDVLVAHGGQSVRFDRVPILAEHISIPPHDIVSTAKHSYSFNESGSELCFHSPDVPAEQPTTLAVFLEMLAEGFLGGRDKVTPETAVDLISDVWGADDRGEALLPDMPDLSGGDPIGNWLVLGDELRRNFSIEQYAFVSWDEK